MPKGDDQRVQPEVIGKRGLKPETVQLVQAGMRDVVNSPMGTGKKAQLPDILVAGKTGTSQVIPEPAAKEKSSPGSIVIMRGLSLSLPLIILK